MNIVNLMNKKFLILSLIIAFFPLTNMAETSSSVNDKLNALIEAAKEKKFEDDAFLDHAKNNYGISLPSAPAQCTKEAWQRGANEAISGQRFLLSVNLGIDVLRDITTNPQRRACNTYSLSDKEQKDLASKSGNFKSIQDKQNDYSCCMVAYQKSLSLLFGAIISTNSDDPVLEKCREEFRFGRDDANVICDANGCPAFFDIPIFLGCYSLGYTLQYASCPRNKNELEILSRVSPGLYDRFRKYLENTGQGSQGHQEGSAQSVK